MKKLKVNISERKIALFLNYLNIKETTVSNHINLLFLKDKIATIYSSSYLNDVQRSVTVLDNFVKIKRNKVEKIIPTETDSKRSSNDSCHKEITNETWARVVDLPGLEDNISPSNNIDILFKFVVNDLYIVVSRSSDCTERQYLVLRIGVITMDVALMTYGPAYQLSVNNILLTDKLYTTNSGQYLDLLYSPLPCNVDVVTILYRKVSAGCPEFWTHFHGVETSLVANFGNLNLLLHQDAIHTLIKYSRYLSEKIAHKVPDFVTSKLYSMYTKIKNILHKDADVPVPPGSVKFSHSARLMGLNTRVCDSDFDIVNIEVTGLEVDFLFRANERFVFRAFLSNLEVDHLSEITLYSKILHTDEDKVFEMKYVRHSSQIKNIHDISPNTDDVLSDGSFKINLGKIHFTFLYKLVVQLQRFVVNLEALPYILKTYKFCKNSVLKATDTFTSCSKIYLSVNLCGPVLLFPQKSSSPNVLIVNTGNFHMENFFKDCPNDILENILIKWTNLTVFRGVMTLTSTLESQESLMAPLHLNMDIKQMTSLKTSQKLWDIDGVLDLIEITLGQKDLATIFLIYTDNIGEGKLIDILPLPVKSSSGTFENDETVKNLEAFFCEPKQKKIMMKFTIDGIIVMLFFDSGELLSSPIRDLNHGLCKFEAVELYWSVVYYLDGSIDGKFSLDNIVIEEIGPDINVLEKRILQCTNNEHKNNNCNITVNKPPIIDITFHQNKTDDCSIDIIVGKLSLNLSVPFCEKLALFLVDCVSKDVDLGLINHGYEGDNVLQNKCMKKGLTISFRLNKPEFVFLIETTSNKKRYFVTKCEVLADYSRHGSNLNSTISLSGLHTLFYDIGQTNFTPYIILRQCDLELCSNYSEEKGYKMSASISAIYIKMCSSIFHSLNDVLNDISEHFKVPIHEPLLKSNRIKENSVVEDLWEAQKMDEFFEKPDVDAQDDIQSSPLHEVFLIPKFDIIVIFELEEIQVLLFKTTCEITMYNWSELLSCTCEFSLQANYFNETIQCWEPLIDPVVIDEKEYKAWDVLVKIFQDKALPMLDNEESRMNKNFAKRKSHKIGTPTTTEGEDSEEDMVYMEPSHNFSNRNNRRVKTSLSTFLDDSDSENEEGVMEKLSAAISDLFTGDWNESDISDCEHSSDADNTSDEEVRAPQSGFRHAVLKNKKAFFILVDAKETLNLTITPAFLKLFKEMVTAYSSKTLSIINNNKNVIIINDIGPKSKVEFYEKVLGSENTEEILLGTKTFENVDSPPMSPLKTTLFDDDANNDNDSNNEDMEAAYRKEFETNYDFKTIGSLNFPIETTAQLYEKVNKHFIQVYLPNFEPTKINCSKSNWSKLFRVQSTGDEPSYYLAAKHIITKHGRTVTISSPLQIKNETCHAINVLYQPSVLQQLNLEPVGDVSNPFNNFMRIAVLEPHEEFNVPLHLAYYCKLFIQPTYAAENFFPRSGLWWKDLSSELETARNYICEPKNNSSLEPFALRILLKKNLDAKNSQLYSIPNYVIYLLPPLQINNYLPYSLEIEIINGKSLTKIEPGEKNSIYGIDLTKDQKLSVRVKLNTTVWSGTLHLTTHLDEKVIALSTSDHESNKMLAINVKAERESYYSLYFFATYWIINKTGLPLRIKASSSNNSQECNSEEVLLFTYKRHGKQSLNLQVYESNWSSDFGLECAGSAGLIVCKDNERKKKYMFFLSIKLSSICPRLTKLVMILPSHIVTNVTNKPLRFMEQNEKTDLWLDLPPQSSITFWPETNSYQMYVKYRGSKVISQPFFITLSHRTVLRMDKGTGLSVEVTGGVASSFKIIFSEYKPGDAPIFIKNYCPDMFMKINQHGQSPVTLLNPNHSLMYTWDDPTGCRQLIWNVYNNKGKGVPVDTSKDGYGEERIRYHVINPTSQSSSSDDDSDSSDNVSIRTTISKKIVRKDKITIYWLCFAEGIQRVLLFTQESRIYNHFLKTIFHEPAQVELLVSISGFGVSVFTSETSKKEQLYALFSDIPAIWEVNVGHKWKTLTLELASWIEDKYRLHYKKCQLKDYVHIDFEKMFMLKPFFAELRRTYMPSIYFHFRKSRREQYFNLQINGFQVDNKETNTVVVHPLPSDNIKNPPPFVEITISKIISNDSCLYRHIKYHVGNFSVNMESQLLLNLSKLLLINKRSTEDVNYGFMNNMTMIHNPITKFKAKNYQRPSCIIENVYLNTFNIQLNIANRTNIGVNHGHLFFSSLLNILFPINISPYMPLEGICHKLNSIQRTDLSGDFWKISKSMLNRISMQFLQQYYSHVLGLQVLVNSYAMLNVSVYGDTPWEPIKMSSILFYGSRCLLGHINMSPAALEQSIIDIFANQSIENIQRIRRHGSYQKSEIIPKSITSSCRNFSVGVPNALNQLIVRSQNAGFNNDGEIFFRTTGKALLSLVTRHPDEKSDSVELAKEALRRASILGEPIRIHQRLTRYKNKYLGLKPMSIYESIGHHLLENINNCRFSQDNYWAHAACDKNGKTIVIVSLEHIIKINKCRIWAPWSIEWTVELDDVISLPKMSTPEIILNLRPIRGNGTEILKICGEKEILTWLHEKIEQAIVVSMEEKSWSDK